MQLQPGMRITARGRPETMSKRSWPNTAWRSWGRKCNTRLTICTRRNYVEPHRTRNPHTCSSKKSEAINFDYLTHFYPHKKTNIGFHVCVEELLQFWIHVFENRHTSHSMSLPGVSHCNTRQQTLGLQVRFRAFKCDVSTTCNLLLSKIRLWSHRCVLSLRCVQNNRCREQCLLWLFGLNFHAVEPRNVILPPTTSDRTAGIASMHYNKTSNRPKIHRKHTT
jgi:hypothetical protein